MYVLALVIALSSSSLPNIIHLHPGTEAVFVGGDATLGPGSQIQVVVSPGSTLPVLTVGGTLTLNNPMLVVTNTSPIPTGTVIMIVEVLSPAAIVGTFSALPHSAAIVTPTGQAFLISYTGGTGNDITLTAIDAASIPLLDTQGLMLLIVAIAAVGVLALRH